MRFLKLHKMDSSVIYINEQAIETFSEYRWRFEDEMTTETLIFVQNDRIAQRGMPSREPIVVSETPEEIYAMLCDTKETPALAAVNVTLDSGAYMPEYAHFGADAGADIRTPTAFSVMPHSAVTIDTGVHIEIPAGYVGLIKSKSGLNVNRNILTEGVIDHGYTGTIRVKLYNHGEQTATFERGDKITQLVVVPFVAAEFTQVDEITGGERGSGGFGSTGR